MSAKFLHQPHKRFNPLTGEWVLVSPQRLRRPWRGKVEEPAEEQRLVYDPDCYLCPGNKRAGGTQNPNYASTFVFDNDFSALLAAEGGEQCDEQGLLVAQSERGLCRVICFSPRHDLTLAEMTEQEIRRVIDVWAEQYIELGSEKFIRSVQIFENKGQIMGCSNPHPHGQIWATETLPVEPAKEQLAQKDFYEAENKRCLLCEYLSIERSQKERLVCENDLWVALVPFWAKWPFETMLLPKRHLGSLAELQAPERDGLANLLKRLTTRYDNLFQVSFPYTMGFHQSPTDGAPHPYWHLHAHFYPPLLRSATVQKFMVGFEMLGSPQRDFTPEDAASTLQALSEEHYRDKIRS
jgi:UDPglucose--hexose-1-phosphate uridylyltransferase